MKEEVLEAEGTESISQRSKSSSSVDASGLEKKLSDRLDSKLADIKKGIQEGLQRMQEKMNPLVDERIKKALSGSFAALTNTTKEALTQVVQAILFDSGILERLVSRIVEEKVAGGGGGGGEGQGLGEAARKDVMALFQKELTQALASEQMKMIIDDKFRTISLYLKTDVIPKTVNDILKQKGAAAAKDAPALAGKGH